MNVECLKLNFTRHKWDLSKSLMCKRHVLFSWSESVLRKFCTNHLSVGVSLNSHTYIRLPPPSGRCYPDKTLSSVSPPTIMVWFLYSTNDIFVLHTVTVKRQTTRIHFITSGVFLFFRGIRRHVCYKTETKVIELWKKSYEMFLWPVVCREQLFFHFTIMAVGLLLVLKCRGRRMWA